MKLTLLGTGTPSPDLVRRGASQVVELGDNLVLIDCGRGALDRFVEAGYVDVVGRTLAKPLHTLAITHLHSDHVTGIPDLLWAGWIMRWWQRPPRVVGPPGTAAMIHHLMEAFAYDIHVRTKQGNFSREALVPEVIEVDEGWESRTDGWLLKSFRVDHEPVDQAFGYRLDTDTGSLAISGDTRYSDNLIRNARNVDLLVHEVYSRLGMEGRRALAVDDRARSLIEGVATYHTPSDAVGLVADRANVKQLVMSHVLLGRNGSAEDILSDVRASYDGPSAVASDLDVFSTMRS